LIYRQQCPAKSDIDDGAKKKRIQEEGGRQAGRKRRKRVRRTKGRFS